MIVTFKTGLGPVESEYGLLQLQPRLVPKHGTNCIGKIARYLTDTAITAVSQHVR
jgi:hypothetical protein